MKVTMSCSYPARHALERWPGIGWNHRPACVESAGTFYLELWDPSTNTILARVMDAEADQQPFAQQANAVTNRQAADIILTNWADDLVRHLDAVRGKPPSN
jgi:hypothetical protein